LAFLFLPSFALAATIQAQHRPWAQQSGLVGYWSFDGKDLTDKIYDRSGAGNHGYVIGAATTTVKTIGKLGQGIALDGNDDYVFVRQNATIDSLSDSLTLSAWIKVSGAIDECCQRVVDVWTGQGFYISIDGGFGGFYTRDNDADSAELGYSVSVTDNEWHHILGVRNGSVFLYYQDGVLIEEGNFPAVDVVAQATGTNLSIGSNNTSNFFPGTIDEVRIYNRALSAAEVKALYNAGQAKLARTDTQVKNGLVGWWTFDGKDMTPNVRDRSGNGNHGRIQGQTSTTTVLGKVGQALRFDGTDDFVSVGNGNGLNISGDEVSVAFWAKQDAYKWAHIYERYPCYYVDVLAGGKYSFRLTPYYDSTGHLDSNSIPKLREWNHIVGVKSPTDMRIYVNGKLDGQKNYVSALGTCSNTLIGRFSDETNYEYNGSLDDVRVYNRALSAAEVMQLYNEGVGLVLGKNQANKVSNGLVGYWSFNGPDFTDKVYDRSGQGNHGYVIGTATTSVKAAGKIGQGTKFSSSTDYIDVGASASLNDISEITICAWVFPRDLASLVDPRIFAKADGNGNNGKGFFLTSENALAFRHGYSDSTSDNIWVTNPGTVPDDEWSHVCATFDNSSADNDPNMYINGKSVSSALWSTRKTGTPDSDASFRATIGNRPDGARPYRGILDEIRVYNRILSADEIKQLYLLSR
jgi:hypothetical protein